MRPKEIMSWLRSFNTRGRSEGRPEVIHITKPYICVVWCGVAWCGVVWCGVVWCGVVWCGVAWRGSFRKVWTGIPGAYYDDTDCKRTMPSTQPSLD